MKFVVKLANNERANRDITINYKTLDNYDDNERATAGDYNSEETDYIPTEGTLTINQGNKTGAVYVKVKGDTNYEDNEYVYLEFSPVDDTIDTISNTLLMFGYIRDNDTNPDDYIYRNITSWGSEEYDSDLKEKVKIVPKVTEGNTKMKYYVDLGEEARSNVKIYYKTVDGTAKAGVDYESKSGTLEFTKGKQESKEFEITIINDSDFEIEEKLYVEFSGPNIDTFKIQGIIKPDEDKDTSQTKPDLTTKETTYNDDTGELSIKLNNTGNRNVQLNYPQVNSLFEATTNKNNKQSGTPEIKIGNTTYYVSKNDITYLDIENQNFDTYFNGSYGKNIKSTKENTYEIIPSYDVANHNYYSITNNPGLKAGDSIEFKIKASFKKYNIHFYGR